MTSEPEQHDASGAPAQRDDTGGRSSSQQSRRDDGPGGSGSRQGAGRGRPAGGRSSRSGQRPRPDREDRSRGGRYREGDDGPRGGERSRGAGTDRSRDARPRDEEAGSRDRRGQGRPEPERASRGRGGSDRGSGRTGGRDDRRGSDRDGRRSGARREDRPSGGRPGGDRGPRRDDRSRDDRSRDDRAGGGRGFGDRGRRPDDRDGAQSRAPRPDRPPEPEIPEGVEPAELDRAARSRLRTLSKPNAERVAQHLVMAGRLLEDDPEQAYEHAQAAVRRAGRVDVVREAAALTAYATGRYAEALRELRTVRRLSGVDAHRAVEADCERGLGRPDRALAIIAEAPSTLSASERAELAIVASGARLDLDEPEAALSVLERAEQSRLDADTAARLAEARHEVLVRLGRAAPREEPTADSSGESDTEGDTDIVAVEDTLEEE